MTLLKDLKLGSKYVSMIPQVFENILSENKRLNLVANKNIFSTFEGCFEGEYLKLQKSYDDIKLILVYFFKDKPPETHICFMNQDLIDIVNYEFTPDGAKLVHQFFHDLYTELKLNEIK